MALAEVGGVVWIYTRRRLLCPICAETKAAEEDVESMHEAGRRQEHQREQRISLVSAARPERHVTSRQQWRGALGKCRKAKHSKTPGTRKMSMIGQHDEAERHPRAGGERSTE